MDLLANLLAIVFTEYEAKTYLALLADHPATGYQLAKQSGVPRSMVYEALGRLRVRGAVLETNDGRASQYRPLPPDLLLEQQEAQHRRLMGELRDSLGRLYAARHDDRVWSIGRRRSVLSYAAQMVREARRELYLVLADPELADLREPIRSACGAGVVVRSLLTGQGELDCGQSARHSRAESELQELTGTLVVVADGREVLIARGGGDAAATVTRNPNLVLIARQFVWMELFAQRVYAGLGSELLARLDEADRRVFESLTSA